MILVNIFRSSLDDKHDTLTPGHEITIRELFPDTDFTNSIISVNGFLQDEAYLLKDGDICAIRLFPEGEAKDWFAGLGLGGALGLIVGGLISMISGPIGWVGFGLAIGIGAAAGTLGAGIASAAGWSLWDFLVQKPGTADTKSADALQQIPQLRGAKNQSAYGHPVPIVLGKHLFTPLYIGRPYTTIGGTDGEDQYFHALYLLGYSRLKISDIKLGEIGYLAGNGSAVMDGTLPFDGRPEYAASNPRLELQQGASEVSLYPQAVVEEQLSVELSYPEGSSPLQALRHTAQNPMKVQVEFTLNNGLISYNDKGDKQDAAVSVSIQWRKTTEDDSDNWKPFGQAGAGQAGIYYSAPVTTITRQKAKIMRFVAERDFSYSDVKDASARTIELRIARTNIQANDNRTADRVYLTAIRTWLFDPDASAAANSSIAQVPMIAKLRDKTARLGFSIKATDALQGNIDSLNCIVQSYGRVWDGTQWTDPDWNIENQAWDTGASASREVPANNPASMALKLLQSPGLGRKAYPDGMLDMDSFAGFYEWCDERGYACNGVLAAEKRLDDVLAVILFTGRAMRILNGDKYGILVDKPREYPVMVLNSQNVLEASNQKAFEEVPDGLSIKFINEADGYQETEVYVMADGSKKPGPASVIESADMPYVTSYEQVVKNGWYQLACKRLRPEVWTRKVSVEGYLIGIGDRVEVQDDTIVVGIGEGAAIKGLKVEDGLITEIQTDGVFDVTDTAKQYGIKIMQFDGANPGTIRTIQVPVPEPGIYCNFTVAIPLDSDPPLPHEGDIIAFGVYGRITTPALCFGKKNNGDGTFELTLIPYQEGIYTTDSGIIPPYEANITTPQALAPPGDMPPDPVSKSEILESISGMDFTGAPAVVYELRPGVSVIKREDDGTFTPGAVSCAQVFITGDGLPETAHKTLSYITSEDDTPEYYTVPVTAGGWDWIEFILSDNDVELDRQRVPVLRNGIPATVYELRPSVNVISRAQDGITLEPSEISCAQEAVTGTGAPAPSGKTLKYIASGDSDETDYSGPVAVDSAWEWIEFRLYDGDSLLDRERVLILYQYVPATVYELLPGVSVIKHKYDDTIEPSSISCGQVKYTPGLSPSPGDKVIRYVTSNNPDTETDYTGEITINPAWAWIEFRLYEGASLLDLERVPVVYDGSDGIAAVVIDFANDNKIIPCGEDGVPYPGVLPFTNQGTLYNAGGGPAAWSLDNPPAGVTIDQAGLVTVADGAALGEAEEIRVSLVLGGKTYGKTFNITKIIDGSNPVFVDLENDNKTIACDEDGVPLLDALPFTNQAVLYRGNAAVTEGVSWRVENAAPGLSIDGEGLISAEAGTQFADNNDIGVTATLGGADYTAVFTVSKAYAGKSPVVIHLDNQNRELMCDIDGNVKPGQLPMAMKAELYRGTARVTGYVGMAYYPVSGGDDLIDPMPGVPYPVEPVIIWSLLGAPPGV
ncbi:MAG: hypothetical protein LBK83_11330, partial [Treponema sp.]|nr:hypothetical protein [Treponema sp.]